jgi:uncharacterized protein (DUF1330 family)
MAKGYWIAFYRSISDPTAVAAYAKLARPAVIAHGGRYLARADAVKVYEQGIAQRTVVTEFDSVEQAIAAHEPRLSRGTQGARQRVRTRRAHRRRGGLKTFHANESVTGRKAHTAMSALGSRKYSLRADDVRSTPESGLKSDIRACPYRAKTGSRNRLIDLFGSPRIG